MTELTKDCLRAQIDLLRLHLQENPKNLACPRKEELIEAVAEG